MQRSGDEVFYLRIGGMNPSSKCQHGRVVGLLGFIPEVMKHPVEPSLLPEVFGSLAPELDLLLTRFQRRRRVQDD